MEIPKKEYKIKQCQIVKLSKYYEKVVKQSKLTDLDKFKK
jgi:hypothetical protein